jgi:apolipoprotein N-acyltransferase
LVQESIPQKDKWDADKSIANTNRMITRTAGALNASGKAAQTIAIWPETAISSFMLDANPALLRRINNLVQNNPKSVLIAGYFYEQGGLYRNALRVFSKTQNVPIYTKHHLVPFGEYMPFGDIIPIGSLVGFDGFAKGAATPLVKLDNLPAFIPLICYEIIFGNEIRSPAADWILTVANDAWYGDTAGPHQHLDAARMRAIEQGIPVVRSANTGISAVIDPYGRLTAQIPYNANATILTPLPQPAKTGFYRFGQELLFFLSFGLCLAILGRYFVKRT